MCSSRPCCARRGTGCRRDWAIRRRCWWSRPPAGSTRTRSRCSGPPTSRPPRTSRAAGSGFADIGAAPAWRNLRAPLAAIPRDATQIRVVASDDDLAPQHWIAVTPPRIPKLRTLQEVVGSDRPGAAGLAGRAGLPVPAAVRPPERRHRAAEVAHPAGPVRRRGQLAGDGQHRRRPAGHQRTAVPRGHRADLSQGRLVPGLGRAAAAQRRSIPTPQPARLDLGTATRSGFWSPAPLRPT